MSFYGTLNKGNVISSVRQCKDGSARFTTVSLKAMSDLIRYRFFCFLKLFIFICGYFRVRTTTVASTFFIRLRFQGYRCESGIAIFAWRVTYNYAYSLFMSECYITMNPETEFKEFERRLKFKRRLKYLVGFT